jgi:hypothetical protein
VLLKRIEIGKSPLQPDRVRLSGQVVYNDKTLPAETYWFDVPEEYRGELSETGNPWLICLIPLAVTLGEPLRIDLPVDTVLYKNIQKLQTIWKCWYPHLSVVPVEADLADHGPDAGPKRNAAFFSGGIDSFYTVLRHEPSGSDMEDKIPIDDLLTIGGFDIPVENFKEFEAMHRSLKKTASRLGKNSIDVLTNIRATAWNRASWGWLTYGCGLATIAHLFEKRFDHVLIASSGGYRHMYYRGSHVLTDPLLTSSRLKFVHDGAEATRVEKTQFIAHSPEAMDTLHVCYKLGSEKNCGRCSKCYRTMFTLDILGVLDKFKTFDLNRYNAGKTHNIVIKEEYDRIFMNEIKELARGLGRRDMVTIIDASFRRSNFFNPLITLAKKLRNRPWTRPAGAFMDKYLLSHLIQ